MALHTFRLVIVREPDHLREAGELHAVVDVVGCHATAGSLSEHASNVGVPVSGLVCRLCCRAL